MIAPSLYCKKHQRSVWWNAWKKSCFLQLASLQITPKGEGGRTGEGKVSCMEQSRNHIWIDRPWDIECSSNAWKYWKHDTRKYSLLKQLQSPNSQTSKVISCRHISNTTNISSAHFLIKQTSIFSPVEQTSAAAKTESDSANGWRQYNKLID